jgi:hypothetical protein
LKGEHFVYEKTTFKLFEQLIFHKQTLCGVDTYFQATFFPAAEQDNVL